MFIIYVYNIYIYIYIYVCREPDPLQVHDLVAPSQEVPHLGGIS